MGGIAPGVSGTAELVVGDADTAIAARSGDVPVLATPRLVALCEEATVAAVAHHLGSGETTVGVRVELDHMRATGLGSAVAAHAAVVEVAGRRLAFDVSATDEVGEIAAGKVVRILVDRDRFVRSLQ